MRILRFLVVAVICLLGPGAARAMAQDAMLLRLFLTDGSSLVSYGEFARVDDRVIFSMPIGGNDGEPRLQAVSLAAHHVDWARTDRHLKSARYQRYAQTRGEEDFLRLNNDVAAVLNEILLTTDRTRALELARQARATLVDWPQEHYGYRQRDVQDIVAIVDGAISDLRAAAGGTEFDLALVAMAPEFELEPIVGMPSIREQVDQVFRIAALTERASDRVALLQAALLLLGEAGTTIPASEIVSLRRNAEIQIREEHTVDVRYNEFVQRVMASATQAAGRARSADIERLMNQIPREDARLGRRRPDVVASLHASLQGQLEAARHLRLLRDRWTIRRSLYRDYEQSVGAQLRQLVRLQPNLEAIRRLEGPSPDALLALRNRLSEGAARLARVRVPVDLSSTHELLVGAWRLAENAVNSRYEAARFASVDTAWQASSSAAGALLLLSRVQQEIRALLEPPRLQ